MGIPKFYRWITERYPCTKGVVKEQEVPEFDNLYLDMNGIIHSCSHPNGVNLHFNKPEKQIFIDICNYIEALFRIVEPKKVFFMAVDGVAPRAKMNEQRGRRFKHAKQTEEKIREAKYKGESLPSEKAFDTNSITPGTNFMIKLQEQLEFFVKNKITTDSTWQGIQVYLSGHQTPGEGEHKIMEFIRYQKTLPDYNPNTRHCFYGSDADLMILTLSTHEPHFSLLREEVKFGRSKPSKLMTRVEDITFNWTHISILRDYIDEEFKQLKQLLPFKYDIESIIDDWILMGFLVGNDFIPNLPNLHISANALPILYECYIELLPTLDGYLNEKGIINKKRFQCYINAIEKFDIEMFEDVYSSYKWLETKRPDTSENECTNLEESKSLKVVTDLAIEQGIISPDDHNIDEDEDEKNNFQTEFQLYKKSYYEEKFHVDPTDMQIASISFEYILALQWICHYYYNGIQSWRWFYPYHYAPFISDLKNIEEMKLKYKLSSPLLPFEQLLAVLPPYSKDCVPQQFWKLFDEDSVIGDFYPRDFVSDLNGKKHEWEAVILIPFINEQRLLDAMAPCLLEVSDSERRRNQHVPCHLYQHDPDLSDHVTSTLPQNFPDITNSTARLVKIPLQKWIKKNFHEYNKGLLDGCNLNMYFKGFPVLSNLPITTYMKKQKVKVFDHPGQEENMIIKILQGSEVGEDEEQSTVKLMNNLTIDGIQKRLLGQCVFVNWPDLVEAKVVGISDGIIQYTHNSEDSAGVFTTRTLNAKEQKQFNSTVYDIKEKHLTRRGIDIGKTKILVYAQNMLGYHYTSHKPGDLTFRKQWSSDTKAYPAQAVIKDILVKEDDFQNSLSFSSVFPKNSTVYSLSLSNYGSPGKVLGTTSDEVTVEFTSVSQPDLSNVKLRLKELSSYQPGWKMAQSLKITGYLLSRITGSIYLHLPESDKKRNIGLNLRFCKECCGIEGYTIRRNKEWLYSPELFEVLKDYIKNFPKVFIYLKKALSNGKDNFKASEMFGEENLNDTLQELSKFLRSLPCYRGNKVHESSEVLEASAVDVVVDTIKKHKEKSPEIKQYTTNINANLLYKRSIHQRLMTPDRSATYEMLDRIVNIRSGYSVPTNCYGTVIGHHMKSNHDFDLFVDVLFDEEFSGGTTLNNRCPDKRGYELPTSALINLSHGKRMQQSNLSKPVAVVNPTNHQL